jgi:4'-phosphopantetheinyl transferase
VADQKEALKRWIPGDSPELERGEIHVWLARLDTDVAAVQSMHGVLSTEERDRAARFKIESGAERYTMARGFLRRLLGMYLQRDPASLAFTYNSYGKPALSEPSNLVPNGRLCFNLSHSAGLALYAFTWEGDLGVDIEKYREEVLREKLADRFFSSQEAEELAALHPADQLRGFFTCWTRKESYIKARGDGLSRSLNSFAVSLRPQEPPALRWCQDDPAATLRWRVWDVAVPPGYAASLMAPATALRCRRFELLSPDKPPLVSEAGSETH